jgi:hypothetical protein
MKRFKNLALLLALFLVLPETYAFANQAQSKMKRAKKKAKRKPSSIESPGLNVVVFSETHNFEAMVNNRISEDRAIASQSQTARVIGVRRELGLTEAETAKSMQNIVINGGRQNGFEKGMILTVSRKVPIIDPYRENRQNELEIEFATARLIQVAEEVSVAKIEKIDSIQKGLFVGTRGILIGDFVK